jgi:hypothetical protein
MRFIERRGMLISLAIVIGLASAFLLWTTLESAYFDYWYYPKGKAADPGLYIYPQLRYTIFDLVMALWCIDGLIASFMSFRSAKSQRISKWTRRTLIVYFVLLAMLILGGTLMVVARSHGY